MVLSTILFLLCFCGCSDVSNFGVDYGNSQIYTKKDMNKAIDKIVDEFRTWDGCVLYSIEYAGDEKCEKELEYCRELGDNEDFTQCIVFTSSFRSPVNGGGAWYPNQVYTGWDWYLAREENGGWVLLTWGYG